MSNPSDFTPPERIPPVRQPPTAGQAREPQQDNTQKPEEEYDPKAGFEIPASPLQPTTDRPAHENILLDRFDEDSFAHDPLVSNMLLFFFAAPLIALVGGACSTVAAFIFNTLYALELGIWHFLAAVLIAPWVEEMLKPLGVYFLIWKWPNIFKFRIYNAFLAALAGAVFATLENLLYIYVFYPDMNAADIQFRWFYCTALHISCCAIYGYGLTPESMDEIWVGENTARWSPYIPAMIAIGIHALWNLVATIKGIAEMF